MFFLLNCLSLGMKDFLRVDAKECARFSASRESINRDIYCFFAHIVLYWI